MKKLLVFLAVAIAAVSCNKSESILVTSRIGANAQCPMVVDYLTTLTSVEYDAGDPNFVYNYTIDESQCPISVIKTQADTIADNIAAAIRTVPDSKIILDACVDANVVILYKYKGSESGDGFRIYYDPSDSHTRVVLDL